MKVTIELRNFRLILGTILTQMVKIIYTMICD